MEQRFTFDSVAALYDAARPDYPDALFGDVVDASGLAPDDAVLEIGCGTGQATRGFARRGFRILALEPGLELIRTAQTSLAAFENVEFAQATFEAWEPGAAVFKLVIAAQSWHWIAPEARLAKPAAVLAPGGTLAVFGHVPLWLAAPLLDAFRRIYEQHAPQFNRPPPENWYLPSGPVGKLFDESPDFAPATHRSYPWSRMFTSSSYADFLRTRSDHQLLAPAQREAVLAAIAEAIVEHGGQFELCYETHLYMARRTC